MIISVLIPTRKRTELVEKSVKSLLEKAADPSCIEIMIAYDQDDDVSQQYFESEQWVQIISSSGALCQVLQTPVWGYQCLHKYYNHLAEKSQGNWLLIWNDDAVMQSAGWDDHVKANQDFVGMLHMITENYRAKFCLFPLIPRAWLDIFGYVGEIPVDSWIHHICMEAHAIRIIEPTVYHDRYDMTGQNCDETYLNRDPGAIKKKYKSQESQALRKEWTQRLIQYRAALNPVTDI